jgi:hypothetical protein
MLVLRKVPKLGKLIPSRCVGPWTGNPAHSAIVRGMNALILASTLSVLGFQQLAGEREPLSEAEGDKLEYDHF